MTMKYMKKLHDNVYQWPPTAEVEYSTECTENIVCSLIKPVLVSQPQIYKVEGLDIIDTILKDRKQKYILAWMPS